MKGILCNNPDESKKHFFCEPCFSDFILSQCSIENRGQLHKHNGCILCSLCYPVHKTVFKFRDIVVHVSPEVSEVYVKAKEEIVAAKIYIEEQTKFHRQLEESKRTFKAAKINSGLQKHRRYIIENIINLLCPRCRTPFVDFDGCFALNCTMCSCKFCAWCLSDCGEECSFTQHHSHVMSCPSAPAHRQNGYSGTLAEFQDAQNIRRARMITEYIADNIQGESTRKMLRDVISQDLEDLGIDC